MSKISRHEAVVLIQDALEDFANNLGLDYSTIRQEIDGGKINKKYLPSTSIEEEITKEVKEVKNKDVFAYYYSYYGAGEPLRQATVLGKLNALAAHLGVKFEVQPENVTAEKVVAKKTTAVKKTKVKTTKKGKK